MSYPAPVQTGPGVSPSLLYNGYRVFFPVVKWPGRGVDHPPYLTPRLKKDPSNENQLDALFVLNLFPQSTSTCFGHICSPSSGGIYIYIYRTTTDHKEGERLEGRRNVGGSSCNSGDGTDHRVQSLMFIMMMIYIYIYIVQQLLGVVLFQLRGTIRTNYCIYTVYLLMMGYKYPRNM
jgi:hypothetical protein